MSEANLAVVVEIGERLLSTKLFSISMYWLWIYDYFLTLGDEIEYAWSGRRSWIFALFIANRYIPVVHVFYKWIITFDFTNCQKTEWEVILYTTIVVVLAQMTMCLRVYAVTGKNKLLGGGLSVLILAQLCFGIYFTTLYARSSLQPLPEINLDAYKVCLPPRWRPGVLTFAGISVTFDLLTFLIVLATARGSRTNTHPGIPSILDVILRDATIYFLLIFASQLVLFLFSFFAPTQTQLLPGVSQATFLPIMASRLMLSLKKVAEDSTGLWYLSTMGDLRRERFSARGTIHFASYASDVSHEIAEALPPPNEEGVELDSVPQLPRDRGSRQPC